MHLDKTILKQKITAAKIFKLLLVILFVSLYSCSHISPYLRPDEPIIEVPPVNAEDLGNRIILLGDAGAPTPDEPVLKLLEKWSSKIPDKTAVFFLGDNIYPDGLPDENDSWYPEASARLQRQINSVKNSGARAVFIPGNHDWQPGGEIGIEKIIRQQAFVDEYFDSKSNFLPRDGCPGPEIIDYPNVRIIIFDTDFFLNQTLIWQKNCDCPDLSKLNAALTGALESAGDREIIVLSHHPLISRGPHGGFYTWKDHLFPFTTVAKWLWIPLPGIGSLYPLLRWHVIKPAQDFSSDEYKNMVNILNNTFRPYSPLIYAGGHEHILQVFEGNEAVQFNLVSGAGSQKKITAAGHSRNTIFSHAKSGFMVIDFLKNRKVLLTIAEPGRKEVVFQKWLKESD